MDPILTKKRVAAGGPEGQAQIAFDQNGFDAFLATRQEPPWLLNRRQEAWNSYCQKDWPSRGAEEWIRTDIRLFNLAKFHAPNESAEPPAWPLAAQGARPQGVLAAGVDLAGQSICVNGRPLRYHLDPSLQEKGVLFGALESLAIEHGDLVEKHLLQRAVDPHYDKFSALHAAFWMGGTLLYVPRGVVIEQPLHTLSMLSQGGSDLGHLLVILEEGAQATLLDELTSPSEEDAGFHCGATELLVGDGAHLRFVSLQDWGKGVWDFGHQKATLARDASLQWTIGALGGRLAKVNQHVALTGAGAECQVNGVMFTEGRQHISYHTLQHHQAPHCRSDLLYKAALQDKSRTVWRGMIKVDPGAAKTDGYQRNDNLMLSSTARADAIPGLEIEADDVRCTHGSTSGRVDEELIFYATCRGFTRQEAIQMIVTGFFQQVFDRITIDSVREALGRAIARRVREYD